MLLGVFNGRTIAALLTHAFLLSLAEGVPGLLVCEWDAQPCRPHDQRSESVGGTGGCFAMAISRTVSPAILEDCSEMLVRGK